MYKRSLIRASGMFIVLVFLTNCASTSHILHTADHEDISKAAAEMRELIAEAEAENCRVKSVSVGAGHGVGLGLGLGVGVGLKIGAECPECNADKINVERTKTEEKTKAETKVFLVAHALCPKRSQ